MKAKYWRSAPLWAIALSTAVLGACTHQLHTELDIDAEADAVWQEVADFDAYPQWNPFITAIAGDTAPGGQLRVSLRACGMDPMDFEPKVLVWEPNRELRWRGQLWLPGIFDGEHSIAIEAREGGGVRLIHSESFSGLLVPFMKGMIDDETRCGFEGMNAALKLRVESAQALSSGRAHVRSEAHLAPEAS